MSFLYCGIKDLLFVCIYRPQRHVKYKMRSIADGAAWLASDWADGIAVIVCFGR